MHAGLCPPNPYIVPDLITILISARAVQSLLELVANEMAIEAVQADGALCKYYANTLTYIRSRQGLRAMARPRSSVCSRPLVLKLVQLPAIVRGTCGADASVCVCVRGASGGQGEDGEQDIAKQYAGLQL